MKGSVGSSNEAGPWTRKDDMAFENALLTVPEGTPNRWQVIASALPGRSPEEMMARYDALLHDLNDIESGRVEFPSHWYSEEFSSDSDSQPWTEDEHRLFLEGLEVYGKGDWERIASDAVKTRTSTQVATHAQKYFLTQNASKKEHVECIPDLNFPNSNSHENSQSVPKITTNNQGGGVQ